MTWILLVQQMGSMESSAVTVMSFQLCYNNRFHEKNKKEKKETKKEKTAYRGTWKLFYVIHIVVFYIITSCSQLREGHVPKKCTNPLMEAG